VLKGATARRYAQAVFEIASESGNVDRWRQDVRTIADYLGNKRLLFVLSEPKIPAARKELMARDLLAEKVQPEALNLALLLVERGIAEIAPGISTEFERLYNDYRGQAPAEVTTAVPLDDDLRAQIASQLQAITGKRVLLRERVDPAILGGAIARVGDTLIDGSLRRRFAVLRQQIAAGAFGGPDDGGSFVDVAGGDGGPGQGGAPAGAGPAGGGPVVDDGSPSGTSQSLPGAPAAPSGGAAQDAQPGRSNETALRHHDAPHVQPRPRQGEPGGAGKPGASSGSRSNRPTKRRRR
jgi:F-type H+-transporting ATPase subunit delta